MNNNAYIDVRGPHPILVNGVRALELDGMARGITVERLTYLVENADLRNYTELRTMENYHRLRSMLDLGDAETTPADWRDPYYDGHTNYEG